MRFLWVIFGFAALGLGLVGIALPLLPTVPFLLLAAFFFARSSERLHNWLITHPRLGPPIEDWNMHGAIRRPAKILASASILAAFVISILAGVRPIILAVQAITLCAVALFIWTRPEV